MQNLTADQFKQKYGVIGLSQFDPNKQEEGLFSEIKNAAAQGIGKIGQGIQEASPVGGEGVGGLVQGVGKIVGGAAEAVTSPAAPLLNRTIGAATNWIGDKISNIPGVQKFAMSPAGETTSKVAATVGDYANAAGVVGGAVGGGGAVKNLPGKVGDIAGNISDSIPKPGLGNLDQSIYNAASDIKGKLPTSVQEVIPTTQGTITHSLMKAFDLAPSDVTNLKLSTGNDFAPWMADNNLIGTNAANTLGLVKNFFTQNYDTVRSEIGKVDTAYKPTEVPYLADALKQMAADTQSVMGLESVNKEITGLMNKTEISLKDVQRVKELMDDQYNLYKVTGDVGAGNAKQGLANARRELKTFIENEVRDTTGADIREMNNNVATAKSVADAIETRSPKGFTKSNLSLRDAMMSMGLTYFSTPLVGAAFYLMRKVLTSPSIRLRLARYLDKLSDAQRAQVSESLKKGEVPKELQDEIGSLNDDVPDIQMGPGVNPKTNNLPAIEY